MVLEYKNSSEDGVSTTTQSFYRRLIFDRNKNLIQSDAILVPDSAVVKDAQSKANKKKKKKGKAKEPVQETKQGNLIQAPHVVIVHFVDCTVLKSCWR